MTRTGRPPVAGEARSVRIGTRFTKTEAEAVDRSRGEMNRSDFVRQAVNDATKAGEQ